jgi:hypothetical protein
MAADPAKLRAQACADGWELVGERVGEFELVNDFLGYLSDRNYSPRTVHAYAFDRLHFARWLSAERLTLEGVDSDVLLRYLAASGARGGVPAREPQLRTGDRQA